MGSGGALTWIVAVCAGIGCLANPVAAQDPQPLIVSPATVKLHSPEASQQLLVTAVREAQLLDATRSVAYRSLAPSIASVTAAGRVYPLQEGSTEIVIQDGDRTIRVPVEVTGLVEPPPVSFRHEVLPILSKAGCNSGGCHGKAEGQNGFKLSIFGFDAESDHNALVKEARGRRVSLAAPAQSLLLRKATAELPHGGGAKIAKSSTWYRRLERWVQEGAALDDDSTARIVAIEVEPEFVVMSPHATQQLRVTAVDSNGVRRCVTGESEYRSNAEEIAGADAQGLVTVSDIPGEAAILVRHMGQVGVCRVTLPQPLPAWTRPAENNFIDRLAWDKLQQLGIQPSDLADDATFLRRAYLDTIGTLPTASEAREFLADEAPDKRERLVERLLERDEYADYWAMKWADILRVDKSIVSPQGAVAMTRWLRRQFRDNTPYDVFARQIVTVRGPLKSSTPAGFYQVHDDPQSAARALSQVFLGVRIECAQCHHHPFERWSQGDYYSLAGFFTSVKRVKMGSGGEKLVVQPGTDLKHPRTEEPVAASGLGADPVEFEEDQDRRIVLADWMTDDENPFFARMIANRLWAHYFGRGLVEPIDDMRATNPATNEPLLNALADHLVELDYDLKAFTRTLLASRLYQLQSEQNESNTADVQNYSRAAWRPLPAEVLLDAISQVTDIPEHFNGWPEGYRAIQVWDNRMPSYFFKVFGRPQRVSVCECERGNEPSIAQTLHLMNAPEIVRKLRHRDGTAAQLARSQRSQSEIIDELFLTTLSRFPSDEEDHLMQQLFDASEDRRTAVEDMLWVLLNTREFVFNH